MKIRCATVFLNINLQKSHKGLTEQIGEFELKKGELALFLNAKYSAFKAMIGDHTVIHYKSAAGKLTTHDIAQLPELLGGERMIIGRDVLNQLLDALKVKLKEVG
jgi:hypothetical protein